MVKGGKTTSMTTNLKNPNRCTSCILPLSSKDVFFDDQGMCRICSSKRFNPDAVQDFSYQSKSERGKRYEQGLAEQIIRIKEQSYERPFDCLVGISGGRDSSHLLYLLVRKHNLRCLAAYYRTPFTHNVIDENVKIMVNSLNVPLIKMNISQEYHRTIAKEMVILWKKKPNPILPNLACAPCKLIHRELFKIAKKNDIKTIMIGINIFEAVNIAPWQSRPAQEVGKAAQKGFTLMAQGIKALSIWKTGIQLLRDYPELLSYSLIGLQSSVLYMSCDTAFLKLVYPQINVMNYFYEAEWKESECEENLRKIGWRMPPGYKSSWRADCSFAKLRDYMLYKTKGLTYSDAFFSNMVRAGVMTRDEALRRIEIEGVISWEKIEEVCRLLELPVDFFESLG